MKQIEMTCFETGWTVFLDVNMWTSWTAIAASLATVIAAASAIFAGMIAFKQLKSGRDEARRATANNIYSQYLTLCFENPVFAYGLDPVETHDNETYNKYRWFVSNMLFTFEQVLETQSKDEKWINTIQAQLKRHKKHLDKSSTVKDRVWNDELMELIEKAIA